MSEYFIKHFQYLQSLDFEDIEQGNIDWNVYRVPFNYKDRVLKYNIPLTKEEFEEESLLNYKYKKYHYNYRHPSELTEENLIKTYTNLVSNAYYIN